MNLSLKSLTFSFSFILIPKRSKGNISGVSSTLNYAINASSNLSQEVKATKWFFNLTPGSITSWDKFEEAFMAEFSEEETPRMLSSELLGIRMNENEKVKYFNERFMSLLNGIPIKPTETVQIEHYVSALPPNIAMFVKTQRKLTLVDNFAEAIQVEKDFETMSSCLGEEEDLTESDLERVISQIQDEIANLKRNKG